MSLHPRRSQRRWDAVKEAARGVPANETRWWAGSLSERGGGGTGGGGTRIHRCDNEIVRGASWMCARGASGRSRQTWKGRRNDNKEGGEGGNEGHGRKHLYYPTESPP
ncbi:hypothetical protein B0H19DRAFT_1083553 [Mycena capillaripes]|nr:hypothetical protein B0H19DRAFT_1083553 [Mycena capillaripes]